MNSKPAKRGFSLRDIIFLALIGIIFGVIYYGGAMIYNALTIALTPVGFGPMANDITMGLWCMAGPLAAFLLRRPGSAFIGEFLGAAGEMFLGGQWGAASLISGTVQGIATELGFTLTGYKIYNWLTIIIDTFTTTIVTYAWDWFKNGYNHFTFTTNVALFTARLISVFLFCGLLVRAITKLVERSQVLKR